MKLGMFAVAAVLAITPLAGAEAAPLLVTITGEYNAIFQIDFDPIPDYADEFGFAFFNYSLTSPSGYIADIIFASDAPGSLGGGGGITVFDLMDPDGPLINAAGPLLYTGDTSAPTIQTGTYTVTDLFDQSLYTVTIEAATAPVPEPASWAMMIAGFGLIGAAMRRSVQVHYQAV